MGKVYEAEKVFSGQLDRALAGQAVQIDVDAQDDLRTALEFSRRMVDLRPDPRWQFQTVLKVNLIQKLKEQEASQPSGRPWFLKILPREPIWQIAAVLAVMVVVGGVLWGTVFRAGTPEVVNAPTKPLATTAASPTQLPAATVPQSTAAPQPQIAAAPAATAAPALPFTSIYTAPANQYLAADGSNDKAVYLRGEPVRINVSWKNLTSQQISIQEFPPIVSLMEASDGQPVYTFSAGQTGRTISPGENAIFTFIWDQRNSQGNLVSPGRYYLELEEMYYNGQAVKMNLSRPVSFEISKTY